MDQSVFIYELYKGLVGDLFEIPAKGGNGHMHEVGHFFQGDWLLIVLFYIIENGVNPIVFLGLQFHGKMIGIQDIIIFCGRQFIEDVQDGKQALEIRFILQDLYFFPDLSFGSPVEGDSAIGLFKQPADL